MATNKSQTQKILTFLVNNPDYPGKLTNAKAESKWDVANLTARISDLRAEGFRIYANKATVNGHRTTVYRLDSRDVSYAEDFLAA